MKEDLYKELQDTVLRADLEQVMGPLVSDLERHRDLEGLQELQTRVDKRAKELSKWVRKLDKVRGRAGDLDKLAESLTYDMWYALRTSNYDLTERVWSLMEALRRRNLIDEDGEQTPLAKAFLEWSTPRRIERRPDQVFVGYHDGGFREGYFHFEWQGEIYKAMGRDYNTNIPNGIWALYRENERHCLFFDGLDIDKGSSFRWRMYDKSGISVLVECHRNGPTKTANINPRDSMFLDAAEEAIRQWLSFHLDFETKTETNDDERLARSA